MIDLKDYNVQPDEGLFEKIDRRLKMRRAVRIVGKTLAGVAVGGIAVVAVSVLVLQDKSKGDTTVAQLTEINEVAEVAPEQVMPAATATVADNKAAAAEEQAVALPVARQVSQEVADIVIPDESAVVAEMLNQLMPEPTYIEIPTTKPIVTKGETVTVSDSVEDAVVETALPKAGEPGTHIDNLIWAPNIIVPEGDVEENRVFSIVATSELTQFNMHIFNRRGMKVYSTADPNFRWDAAGMPQGAYVWIATFRDSDGRPRQEKGSVVVVR